MKTYSIILLIAALAIGGCSTAYQTGQTPDAVYYSPGEENTGYATSDNKQTVVQGDNPDEGNYVVYNDGQDNYYEDDYYSRRINMFDRPGSLYSFNSMYMMNSPMYWGSPFSMNRYSWNMGLYSNPYLWSFPSLSIGWGMGSPWGMGHMGYSPYSYGYNPYYGGYLGGYGYGYGYGGYGYGGYGKNINITPRPANTYAPRRSVNSRAGTGTTSPRTNSGINTTTPRRVYRSENSNGQNVTEQPRRVFKSNSSETPVRSNQNTQATERSETPRRVFKAKPSEHPVNVPSRRATERVQQPTQRVYQNNTNRVETRSIQPSRSFNNSTPTRSSSSSSNSAPARISQPRGR